MSRENRASVLFMQNPRDRYIARLKAIAGDVRFLYVPDKNDRLVSIDSSGYKHKITHSADCTGRLTRQGNGYLLGMTGASTHLGTVVDHPALRFGDAANDISFSWIFFGIVGDMAVTRYLCSKWDNVGLKHEYAFRILSTDVFSGFFTDDSAGVSSSLASNAAITMGSLAMLGFVYDHALGAGATEANGMSMTQNAATIASTPTNNASFVAMEPQTEPLEIGGDSSLASYADCNIGSMMLCAGATSLGKQVAMKAESNAFYKANM